MTTTPFTQLQDGVNSAIFAALANSTVTIYEVQHPVIFDNAYSRGDLGGLSGALGGMAATQPAAVIASAAVPDDYDQLQVLVDGAPYVIAAAEPDGLGMTHLFLESLA